jgi:hypothetical protein
MTKIQNATENKKIFSQLENDLHEVDFTINQLSIAKSNLRTCLNFIILNEDNLTEVVINEFNERVREYNKLALSIRSRPVLLPVELQSGKFRVMSAGDIWDGDIVAPIKEEEIPPIPETDQSEAYGKLTPDQYAAYNGLDLFITGASGMYTDLGVSPLDFCFKNEVLFGALAEFTNGRFKCDGGIEYLSDCFRAGIERHPHMAHKYFYHYSQLITLLLNIYEAQPIIEPFSYVFEQLTDKSEFYFTND